MDELEKIINEFRDERDWRQFHNEKDLAISISLEASELLELFQWKSSEETVQTKRSEIEDELDIVIETDENIQTVQQLVDHIEATKE